MRTFTLRELARWCALSELDLAEVRRRRSGHTRLGFAYQLGFTKMMWRLPRQEPLELIPELLTFMALQVHEDVDAFNDYKGSRRTLVEHQERIRDHLNVRRMGAVELKVLEAAVFEAASRLEQSAALQSKAKEFLREQQVLRPADSTLARIVGEQRERARLSIYQRVVSKSPESVTPRLDDLLAVEHGGVSGLQRIKENPSRPSPAGMQSLIAKLQAVKATGVLETDLSWLSRNYQRALYHYARKASADRLRQLAQPRRHATLVCFLWQSYGDTVDQVIDMFDKMMTRTSNKAREEIDARMRQQRAQIKDSLAALQSIGAIVLDDSIADADVRSALFDQVPRESIAGFVEDAAEWITGRSSDPFHGFTKRYATLRKFTPAFLQAVRFRKEAPRSPCLQALNSLRELNESSKRKPPEGTSTDFVPRRLRHLVVQEGKIDRRAWECSLLLQLQEEIRSGNVSVEGSKRFRRLDDFCMPKVRWEAQRESFFARSSLPADPRAVADYLRERLGKAFDRFLDRASDNVYATVDSDGWRISTDAASRPDAEKLAALKAWLSKRVRRINLPDLLIEADNDVGFTKHFLLESANTPLRTFALRSSRCSRTAAILVHTR